jgi:hypothetical protein
MIIMPVHVGGNHWAALFIHFSTMNRLSPRVCYADPYGMVGVETRNEILDNLISVFGGLKRGDHPKVGGQQRYFEK